MQNLYTIFKSLVHLIAEILRSLRKSLKVLITKMWDKFKDGSLSDKIIVLNVIPSFFAVVLPVAKFDIFGSYSFVNNPFSVHLIGIIILMFPAAYFKRGIRLSIRIILNVYYLFWVIYTPLSGQLTKAQPYDIIYGYYFSIAVPLIFIGASVLNYYED